MLGDAWFYVKKSRSAVFSVLRLVCGWSAVVCGVLRYLEGAPKLYIWISGSNKVDKYRYLRVLNESYLKTLLMKINISTYLPNSLRQEREFDAFLQFFICYVNSLKNLIWQMHEFYLTLVKIDVAKNCTISCIILLWKNRF